MLLEYVELGGPVMYVVLLTWVVVIAAVLDRVVYGLGRCLRRPLANVRALARAGKRKDARFLLEEERERADRRLTRIDAVSQIAPSIGLFGTVLGMAQSFLARGGVAGDTGLSIAAPEALAAGLSTALFTTVAGLIVFLFGQAFLIAWNEWQWFLERGLRGLLLEDTVGQGE